MYALEFVIFCYKMSTNIEHKSQQNSRKRHILEILFCLRILLVVEIQFFSFQYLLIKWRLQALQMFHPTSKGNSCK